MSISLFLRREILRLAIPRQVILRAVRAHRLSMTLAVLPWLLAAPVFAASADLRLEDAVRLAVERAPALVARQSQAEAAHEEGFRAGALPDPKLILAIDNLTATGPDAFDFGADDMTMKRIGLMQEFPARAKRHARQALADRTIEQADALTIAEQLLVRRGAAEAWVSLWSAQREIAALHEMRAQSTLAVRLAKARMGGGSGTAMEALAAQSAALELENRIETATTATELARATLDRWLGESSSDLSAADTAPDFNALPTTEASLLASVDRQGALLPWRSREAVAAAQVDLAIAEKRRDWSIGASYGQRDRSRSDMLTVEFAIGLPLFPRNRQDRGVAARRAELDAVLASREDARRMQVEQVRRGLAEWAGFKRQVARDEQQLLPLARDRTQTAVASYGGGGELQPWLDARRDEIQIRIDHARRLGELGRAWTALAYLLPDHEAQP